jgi:2-dehydro-3-deoxy-D-arabinonate dehydratase
MALWRVRTGGGLRLARGDLNRPVELLPEKVTLDGLLAGRHGSFDYFEQVAGDGPVPDGAVVLPPVGGQEVWAAGVTYERSLDARREEAVAADPYEHVYGAVRPELFLKAAPGRTRGHGQPVGIRRDSTWDVPEPELACVLNAAGEIVAFTVGNDVSSRSIEGENPLYLPQAKVYEGSCALGPCLVPVAAAPPRAALEIGLTVERGGQAAFTGTSSVARMRRSLEELAAWLFAAREFPVGAVLLTGTDLVPPPEFTLEHGDRVTVAISGVGTLVNDVERVGRADPG